MRKYIAIIVASILCAGCVGLFKQKDYGDGVVVEPLQLRPISPHVYEAVQPGIAKTKPVPVPPVTVVPPPVITGPVKITPIKITPIAPTNSANLIAGDGGCVKTNAPPIVVEPADIKPIEIEPMLPAPTIELPPIVIEKIELREVELPVPFNVQIWWLLLYYGLAGLAILGGVKLWNVHKTNKKPAPKKRRRRRTTKKKR